mmetsp:Transcript_108792/g.204088  ORF Transcript_108792/g.204088 Transcript_108792/m.204088 type:complete len:164 (-) Transcript_108792:84-575(-)
MRRSQSGPSLRAAAAATLLGDSLARSRLTTPLRDRPEQQLLQNPALVLPFSPQHQDAEEEEEEEELDREEIEHFQNVEAQLEAELEAAFAELAGKLHSTEVGELDTDMQSRVAQLAPRLKAQRSQQEQLSKGPVPVASRSRGSPPVLPSSSKARKLSSASRRS